MVRENSIATGYLGEARDVLRKIARTHVAVRAYEAALQERLRPITSF